jgi:TolB protein
MTWRSRVGVVALAAVIAAGCSTSTGSTAVRAPSGSPATSTSTTAAQPAAHGVEAAIGAVPWSQVGPGWTLATWSPAPSLAMGMSPPPGAPTRETATTTLYLVDPAGGRYAITIFPPPGDGESPRLVDWSGDGSHALFYAAQARGPSTVITVDLHSGTQTTFTIVGFEFTPRYSGPEGKAVLLAKSSGPPWSLVRVDLAGNLQLRYPTDKLGSTYSGAYLSTSDGTRLVLGTSTGLVLMGNDGTVGSTLSIPGQTDCRPSRWWDGKLNTTVLATCDAAGTSASRTSRLWLVPIDGGAPTALTAPNSGQQSPDLGDVNAWQLPAGTYVQYLGGCGAIHLGKLDANGTVTPVSVPDVDVHHSILVVGVNGGDLDLQAMVAGCAPSQSLIDYNPAAGTSTVLLGPPLNGGAVMAAVPYPGQK